MDPRMEAAVRALEASWTHRDLSFLSEHVAPGVVFDWSESVGPYRGVYRGVEEAQRLFASMLEAFSDTAWEAASVTSIGSRLALEGRFSIRGGSSGVETTAIGGQLWSFTDGRVEMIKIFQSRAEAVRAMRVARLAEAHLYFVCEGLPSGRAPGPLLDAALRGGADVVQLREKAPRCAEELISLAEPFRRAASEHGALFILNDLPELVDACGADGVHVGQDDDPVAKARERAGREALVGLSTHSVEQVGAAEAARGDDRPDQISVGPVWETPTKPGRTATGIELIVEAARLAGSIPWFAIGGIDPETAGVVRDAGATRAVVVRAIRDADDPEAAAHAVREALTGASASTDAEVRRLG